MAILTFATPRAVAVASFRDLEIRWIANCMVANRRAKRLPARLAKRLYGKAKLPYSFIHDEIIIN